MNFLTYLPGGVVLGLGNFTSGPCSQKVTFMIKNIRLPNPDCSQKVTFIIKNIRLPNPDSEFLLFKDWRKRLIVFLTCDPKISI